MPNASALNIRANWLVATAAAGTGRKRLSQLLIDVNLQHQQDADVMPSYGEVLEFFAKTSILNIKTKAPFRHRCSYEDWNAPLEEVAQRFNKRFVSGESQKTMTLSYIKAFV